MGCGAISRPEASPAPGPTAHHVARYAPISSDDAPERSEAPMRPHVSAAEKKGGAFNAEADLWAGVKSEGPTLFAEPVGQELGNGADFVGANAGDGDMQQLLAKYKGKVPSSGSRHVFTMQPTPISTELVQQYRTMPEPFDAPVSMSQVGSCSMEQRQRRE